MKYLKAAAGLNLLVVTTMSVVFLCLHNFSFIKNLLLYTLIIPFTALALYGLSNLWSKE